jgi:dTDP-4-dehydrorhamnose reductase
MMHLRVSIIGPELAGHVSLLDWFRGLPQGAPVTGFDNHLWNGVTTLHFARLALGVITSERFTPGVFHVEPTGKVTKAEMLHLFSETFDRPDVVITTAPANQPVDRTLSTLHAAENAQRWSDAGYLQPPTVDEMIAELAASGMQSW